MAQTQRMQELSERIARARLSGAELDRAARLSLEEGYAVQEKVAAQLGESAGWKIGATNAAAQRFLGVAGPICGRVLAGGLRRSGGHAALPGSRPAEAEPEIVFRLGRDGAIAAIHLGIEVNRPCRTDAFELGAGFIVADNAGHAALVIGPELPLAALDRPETVTIKLFADGVETATGDASAVLGNPLHALAALAAARTLQPGDWIASGAITRACPLGPGSEVVADFGALGEVRIHW